jgi:hypothetical protein
VCVNIETVNAAHNTCKAPGSNANDNANAPSHVGKLPVNAGGARHLAMLAGDNARLFGPNVRVVIISFHLVSDGAGHHRLSIDTSVDDVLSSGTGHSIHNFMEHDVSAHDHHEQVGDEELDVECD